MIEYNGRPFDAEAKADLLGWIGDAWGRTQSIAVGVITDADLWRAGPAVRISRYKGDLSVRVFFLMLEIGG